MNEYLRYKLRMFVIRLMILVIISVVTNVTRTESTLQRKHNSVAYHKVRESVASCSIHVKHEAGANNMADVLTK